jgi:hypothetical protein
VGAEISHADGQTDRQTDNMTKLIVAFCNFANAPKNDQIWYSSFYSSSNANSEDEVPINKKESSTKPEFLARSGSRNITRKVSQICGTCIAVHK